MLHRVTCTRVGELASSLWMGTADDGLAAVAYAPSEVDAVVGHNLKVHIAEDTEYPFVKQCT